MGIIDLLKNYYDREMNNVFCYSANYLMNSPKKGFEQEWKDARERADILQHELACKGVDV